MIFEDGGGMGFKSVLSASTDSFMDASSDLQMIYPFDFTMQMKNIIWFERSSLNQINLMFHSYLK